MNPRAEWIEADGLGGFASGCADGVRTRRYHALLLAATTPPTGRAVLVNGVEAWVETDAGRFALSAQRYAPDVTHPDGPSRLAGFAHEPWPSWTYRLPDGQEVVHEVVVRHGAPVTVCSWRLARPGRARLVVRPFLSGRDVHATHHENGAFAFDAVTGRGCARWQPYPGLPAVLARSTGTYAHEPLWYRNVQYDEERARGLDFTEDLASPGTFAFDLADGTAVLAFGAMLPEAEALLALPARQLRMEVEEAEMRRRARFPSRLHRSADDYLVRRGSGMTIVAGYPWFSDWGRDTFIALRGLCIAGGRPEDAGAILLEWSRHVDRGMLPNFFPEGGAAEYNSVDAALWFCVAVHELLREPWARSLPAGERRQLLDAVRAIVAGYAAGTRHGIRAEASGLLAAGEPGVQLTWMDAKIGDWVVTPRIGKPVEVEALWINALRIAGREAPEWAAMADRAQAAFVERFAHPGGWLHDVVDVDHVAGAVDPSFRPNQLLAVGGLPFPVVDGALARGIVDACEARLWTPAGPRSLAPDEPGYVGRYGGDMRARDAAYHQGTVWPWLAGPFVEAWVRVRGDTPAVRREARERFVAPLLAHHAQLAPGHVAEIADGDAPWRPAGAPFQAWSVGELLRLTERVLRTDSRPRPGLLTPVGGAEVPGAA